MTYEAEVRAEASAADPRRLGGEGGAVSEDKPIPLWRKSVTNAIILLGFALVLTLIVAVLVFIAMPVFWLLDQILGPWINYWSHCCGHG
jgi:hypothetical protein